MDVVSGVEGLRPEHGPIFTVVGVFDGLHRGHAYLLEHFDEAVRRTPYDAFVGQIQAATSLAGLLMTPDAAFGFERRGTPDALAELGRERGFDVVVVPPFTIDGRAVRSSEIRTAIATG